LLHLEQKMFPCFKLWSVQVGKMSHQQQNN